MAPNQVPGAIDMPRLRRWLLAAALAAILLLAVLSLVGAFLGAERAAALFRSPPLAAFWLLAAALLGAGLVALPRLWRRPGLAVLHLGALLVLVGGLWGSPASHALTARLFGTERVARGVLALERGRAANTVWDRQLNERRGRLGFLVRLDDLDVDYAPWRLYASVQPAGDGPRRWRRVPWGPDSVARTGVDGITVGFLRWVPKANDLGRGPLPLLELRRGAAGYEGVPNPRATPADAPVDLPIAQHQMPPGTPPGAALYPDEATWEAAARPRVAVAPPAEPVRSHRPRVSVLRHGEVRATATLAPNHPLHYDGYHIYLNTCDPLKAEAAVVTVVSDRGLWAARAGFVLLAGGAAWQFWLAPIVRAARRRRKAVGP